MQNKLTLNEVTALIEIVNKARAQTNFPTLHNTPEEQQLNELFGTHQTLAVYGTLAPGRQNYHIVEPLGGEWTDGLIEGTLQETGWGATMGYPAFRPAAGGTIVQIKVLRSTALPAGWRPVDEFEGPDYQRILVPVFHLEEVPNNNQPRILYTVANLYAARDR